MTEPGPADSHEKAQDQPLDPNPATRPIDNTGGGMSTTNQPQNTDIAAAGSPAASANQRSRFTLSEKYSATSSPAPGSKPRRPVTHKRLSDANLHALEQDIASIPVRIVI